MKIDCPIEKIVQESPQAIFLINRETTHTYFDLYTNIVYATSLLQNRYIPKLDQTQTVIAIKGTDPWIVSICIFACARSQITLAIVSDLDPNISDVLENIGVSWIEEDILEKIQKYTHLAINTKDHRAKDHSEDIARKDHPQKITLTHPYTQLNLNIPCTMLFTSGSSSAPKAVVHSLGNHLYSAKFSQQNIAYSRGDRWLLSLSLWHIGGLAILFRTIVGTATAVITKKIPMLEKIIQYNITHISLVAVQLEDIVNSIQEKITTKDHQEKITTKDRYDQKTHTKDHHINDSLEKIARKDHLEKIASTDSIHPIPLKFVLIGGGYTPIHLLKTALALQLPIHTTYGMTELASQLSCTSPNSPLSILSSCGSPLGDWSIHISPSGEILVQGSPLFLGYYDGKKITRPSMDGYFPTNDRGYIENNRLYLTGRMDKMFISGGENIHPEEIELWLNHHCSCAIVVPIDHERYGKRPVAFIHQPQKTTQEFREYLLEYLPKFKVPDHLYIWPIEIPVIKPPRKVLEQLAQQGNVRTID